MYISCGLGLLVKSGCTRVKGCLVVNPMSFNLSSNCLSCNSTQFYPNPINNICVCKEGWLIGEYCGNIVGCTQLYFNISIFVCTSCNINNRFILINGTCFCKPYYALSQSTCLEICGDGYLFMLACDDGNLLDGDGCSSTCQVEANYVCRPRLQLPMSQCVFKGRVTLELSRISRLPNSNSATIAFDIIPFESVITKMNFKSLTNFTADSC
jgi:cysteine-rich repeat protein